MCRLKINFTKPESRKDKLMNLITCKNLRGGGVIV